MIFVFVEIDDIKHAIKRHRSLAFRTHGQGAIFLNGFSILVRGFERVTIKAPVQTATKLARVSCREVIAGIVSIWTSHTVIFAIIMLPDL
jgi:hypothetical protein